jgi:hypothetical protein
MFERPITFAHGDGSHSPGRVDCYRRGAFVLESKKLKPGANAHQGKTTKGFDDALLRARSQAEHYARAPPAAEGRPPFVVVVDVGHVIELYAEFTRCLFCMFAEDVGLLPATTDSAGNPVGGFVGLLKAHRDQPAVLQNMLRVLWTDMDRGGFSAALAQDVLRFNGKLFKGAAADGYSLALTPGQIDGLLRAAQANWREVEPAIFGTLLERALHPDERHALGAPTHHGPMSNGWCCPRWWSRCAPTGPTRKPPRCCWPTKPMRWTARSVRPSWTRPAPRSTAFTTSCAAPACSTRPAAAAIFSTSRWSTTPGALTETALTDRFTGRGPWKKRLPQILQTLEALGRARADGQFGGMAWRSA